MEPDVQPPDAHPNGQARATGHAPIPWTGTEVSHTFPPSVIGQIHEMAEVGRYEIRGWGAKRQLPTFDDLVFLSASLTRYPLEGYRERCDTTTVLGTRFASKPIELAIPITIAGMSSAPCPRTPRRHLAGPRQLSERPRRPATAA